MMRNRDYLLDTHINYESKETKRNNLETQLMDAKRILNLISLLLCLLSCLSVISITFFSVKERIPEIGIRKAFGATKMDVVFQFVIEMLIIAFFSSGLAIMLSLFIGRIVEVILDQKYFISFAFKPTVSNILQPFILGVTEALLCGIIPSLYAANIKVTNSLKFE